MGRRPCKPGRSLSRNPAEVVIYGIVFPPPASSPGYALSPAQAQATKEKQAICHYAPLAAFASLICFLRESFIQRTP